MEYSNSVTNLIHAHRSIRRHKHHMLIYSFVLLLFSLLLCYMLVLLPLFIGILVIFRLFQIKNNSRELQNEDNELMNIVNTITQELSIPPQNREDVAIFQINMYESLSLSLLS